MIQSGKILLDALQVRVDHAQRAVRAGKRLVGNQQLHDDLLGL